MLLIIVVVLTLTTIVLIIAGLWMVQQEADSRPPAQRQAGPALPSTASRPVLPPDLQWKRPYRVPWALTRWNAGLYMAYGFGLILTLPFVLYWARGFASIDRSNLSPFGCIFMLPFVVVPLLIVSTQAWMLVTGVRNWQMVKALEARGQLIQGVLVDRWSGWGRGSQYCVAYYFELPWGSPGGRPLIRAEVNKEAHRAYRVADPVQVRYLPDNPLVCRLEV